ncbi:Zinc finger protein 595 [Collichthys lucidus]|uniref:Zinc finger protein 595 n=1 Tax=Collichthys lucidus TaxID=240159 RepID=A0A4U5VC30_COLLU|nr:Zinc finger protein 595 [Collichthys lucidus]
MAESETECDTPGLDTLGSECVIAHSHVDLHYGAETEIMTEEKRGLELEIHGSDLKIQGLGTDLGAVACVDAIVAETDHDYIKVEHGEMHCFTGAEIKTTGTETLLGEVLLKTESEHVVKVESDHGGELTVESENGVIIHEAHGLQCNECGEIFGSIADLHQHFEIHKDLNPYICVHCGESFAVEASLKQHMKIHMKEKPYVPGVEIMGKDVIDAFSLKSHQMIHLPDKPHRCSECVVLGDKPHRCAQCGKCFAAAATLREHQRIHSGEKPYKCNMCRKSFVRKRHLKKHQQVHAGGKPYTCRHCNKGFNHSSSLSRHHKTHLQNPVFSPPPPGKPMTFGTPPKQRVHQQGDKPYMCHHCEKGFNHSSSLSRHQRVHSEGKSYTCAHCGKRFNHSSSLARHQRVHLESKQQPQQPQTPPPQPQQYATIPTGKGFPNNAFPKQHILSPEKPYRKRQANAYETKLVRSAHCYVKVEQFEYKWRLTLES